MSACSALGMKSCGRHRRLPTRCCVHPFVTSGFRSKALTNTTSTVAGSLLNSTWAEVSGYDASAGNPARRELHASRSTLSLRQQPIQDVAEEEASSSGDFVGTCLCCSQCAILTQQCSDPGGVRGTSSTVHRGLIEPAQSGPCRFSAPGCSIVVQIWEGCTHLLLAAL